MNNLIDKLSALQAARYRMRWVGSKIPRGATIGGIEIGWTQHGIVTGTGGEPLGYYQRVTEFSGPDKNEHEIIISTSLTPVIAPDKSACERQP